MGAIKDKAVGRRQFSSIIVFLATFTVVVLSIALYSASNSDIFGGKQCLWRLKNGVFHGDESRLHGNGGDHVELQTKTKNRWSLGGIGRALTGRKAKTGEKTKPLPSKQLAHGYFDMDEERWSMYRNLKKDIDENHHELKVRAHRVRHDLDEVTLIRFLEVSYWKPHPKGESVIDKITQTVKWREENDVRHIHADSAVKAQAQFGKMYVWGHDSEGRPIIYLRPSHERPPFDVESMTRLLIYTLERALRSLPKGQSRFGVIVDCSGFHLSSVPPTAYVKHALSLLQKHYAMRLGYVLMVNAPAAMHFFWKLVSPLLDERTKRKIDFVPPKKTLAALTKRVDKKYLPDNLLLDGFTYTNDMYFNREH